MTTYNGDLDGKSDGLEEDSREKWYTITATYKSMFPSRPIKRNLWERILFLVRATDDSSAEEAGYRVAKEKEHEYINMRGEAVRWEFQAIEEVQQILGDAIKEGTEVSYHYFERVDKRER